MTKLDVVTFGDRLWQSETGWQEFRQILHSSIDWKTVIKDYCAQGFYLLPVGMNDEKHDGKVARLKDWPARASNDPAQVLKWFYEKPHTTGIALNCGKSGIIVVDVDGPKGEATLARWASEGKILPKTRSQVTGRLDGGRHLIFWTSIPVETSAKKHPGIDIRGHGGYNVLAPSPHLDSVRWYTMDTTPIAVAPMWLIEWAGRADVERVVPDSIRELLELEEKTPESDRSEALWTIFGKLIRTSWTDPQIMKLIKASPIYAKYGYVEKEADARLKADIARWHKKHDGDETWWGEVSDEIVRRIDALIPRVRRLPATQQKLMQTIFELVQSRESTRVTRSYPQLMIDASCSYNTVRRNTEALVKAGLLNRVGHGTASIWELPQPNTDRGLETGHPSIPTPTNTHTVYIRPPTFETPLAPESVKVAQSSDVARYRSLGAAFPYLALLAVQPMTRQQLQTARGRSKGSACKQIARLVEAGIVKQRSDDVYELTADWEVKADQLAKESGQAGQKELAEQRLESDRIEREKALEVWRESRLVKQHREWVERFEVGTPEHARFEESQGELEAAILGTGI